MRLSIDVNGAESREAVFGCHRRPTAVVGSEGRIRVLVPEECLKISPSDEPLRPASGPSRGTALVGGLTTTGRDGAVVGCPTGRTGGSPDVPLTTLTSEKPFGHWGEVFGDDTVAEAMIDRLVHHADVIALKGDSYRRKNRDLGRLPAATND